MKVVLKKEAEFEFCEEKYTAIPSVVLSTLVGKPEETTGPADPELPRVIVFENKSDYIANAGKYNIDYGRNIFVSQKGQFFCYELSNATANTKED